MATNEFHHARSAAAQNQRYRMRSLRKLRRVRILATVSPVLPDQRQMTAELLDPGHRILLTDIESGELGRPGPRTEAELESASRRVRQRDGLLGEHGGMPKRVTKDKVADPQPLGLGGHPGGNAHCLPNTFAGQPGRLEVIDEGDSVEATVLGIARPLRDVGDRQPHLRQEQKPLDDHAPTYGSRAIATGGLVYYLYYVRGLMDVGLNAEQLSLRATVRDILRTECPPDAARQALTDPERWRTLWKTVVDLGWTELASPAEDGAGDYGPVELAVVLEECGAALAPIPLLEQHRSGRGRLAREWT